MAKSTFLISSSKSNSNRSNTSLIKICDGFCIEYLNDSFNVSILEECLKKRRSDYSCSICKLKSMNRLEGIRSKWQSTEHTDRGIICGKQYLLCGQSPKIVD